MLRNPASERMKQKRKGALWVVSERKRMGVWRWAVHVACEKSCILTPFLLLLAHWLPLSRSPQWGLRGVVLCKNPPLSLSWKATHIGKLRMLGVTRTLLYYSLLKKADREREGLLRQWTRRWREKMRRATRRNTGNREGEGERERMWRFCNTVSIFVCAQEKE